MNNVTTVPTGITSNFVDLWSDIEPTLSDNNIDTYIFQYGFGLVSPSFQPLENAQEQKDREVWAKDWAIKLSKQDPEALQYNHDRWLCLKFLYNLINNDLLSSFKRYRTERIIRTCLVMDRANTLYNMIDSKTNARNFLVFKSWPCLDEKHLEEEGGTLQDHDQSLGKLLTSFSQPPSSSFARASRLSIPKRRRDFELDETTNARLGETTNACQDRHTMKITERLLWDGDAYQ